MDFVTESKNSLGKARAFLRLLRPGQWIKNGFVLAPLIFSGKIVSIPDIKNAASALVLFCIASSAAYIINDIKDSEKDRLHPVKSKKRPIASGEVSMPHAFMLLAFLYCILIYSCFIFPSLMMVIFVYCLLNVAYTFWLKNVAIVDLFIIAIGFVLRVYAGAIALSVPLSGWMFVTTFCLSLYLAVIKRRQELTQVGSSGRKVLENYSVALVDRYAAISAAGALIFYSLFAVSVRPGMMITIPLVMFGIFRYWYIVDAVGSGESPSDALLSDWPLLTTVVVWGVACVFISLPFYA